MSLESFIGFDQGEGMSESAFEQFKEKMGRAQAQIAAIQKEEKKSKKKEQDLINILLKFIKKSSKKELTLLISRTLEKNIPANFVLAVVLLGNEDIQQEAKSFIALPKPENNEKALIFFGDDQTTPLKVRIELDGWLKEMLFQAEEKPHKMIKTAYEYKKDADREPQNILIQLLSFVMHDFLSQNDIQQPAKQIKEFCTFTLEGILKKTEENIEKRGLLEN
ncbi:hypothetical protein KJ632_04940 [Patescibacteria group bacterium]|nr:hypothetical protein [Patescibacteria group bacterium]